jgi:hypothetical protein
MSPMDPLFVTDSHQALSRQYYKGGKQKKQQYKQFLLSNQYKDYRNPSAAVDRFD